MLPPHSSPQSPVTLQVWAWLLLLLLNDFELSENQSLPSRAAVI